MGVTPQARLDRWKLIAYTTWAIIGIILLVASSGLVLGRISSALAPFVLAFLLVFLMQGAVAGFERRGMRRSVAVLACFAIGFLLLSLAVVFIIPPVTRQLVEFAQAAPQYLQNAEELVVELQGRFSDVVIPEWLKAITASLAQSLSQITVRVGNVLAEGIVSAGSGLASGVVTVFLSLIVAFWVLKDLPKIRLELRTLAGERYEDDFENLLGTVSRVVGGYLKGQTIASISTAALTGIGFLIIGLPYVLVLTVLSLFLNYIPYVGPFLTGLIALLVGLFAQDVGTWVPLLAVVVVIAAQQLTDLFITPRVMSEQVDLHPTLVIFSLLVGGTLFGFWGLIFSIPIAAVGKGLFVYYYERRTNRVLASEDGALFRATQCDDPDEECEPQEDESAAQPDSHKGSE